MSESILGVVVTHGTLGQALVDAVESITGQRGALVAVTNAGCSRDTLVDRIGAAAGAAPCIVFTDLAAGSCHQAAALMSQSHSGWAVVAGVNLPMLVDFVFHRDEALPAVVERAHKAGTEGIRVVTP